MPIYRPPKDDPDGRGIARTLASLQRQINASRRMRTGPDMPDPTPPAVDVPLLSVARELLARSAR